MYVEAKDKMAFFDEHDIIRFCPKVRRMSMYTSLYIEEGQLVDVVSNNTQEADLKIIECQRGISD